MNLYLVFSANIPLTLIAKWFASLSNNLLVEFVPIEDPMIKKLTQNRPEHLPYSFEDFLIIKLVSGNTLLL